MPPSTLVFLAAVAVAAGFALAALRRGDDAGFAYFKLLTTLVILVGAALLLRPAARPYRACVTLGLALSLAGDALLVRRPPRFGAALAAFLLAHLSYLGAFSLGSPIRPDQWPWLVPWLAVGGAVAAYAWRGLGRYRPAVLGYVAAIGVMGWRAAMRGRAPAVPRASFGLALLGAALFVGSDAVLTVRRFRRSFPGAHEIELALYWAAQTLIALSVRT